MDVDNGLDFWGGLVEGGVGEGFGGGLGGALAVDLIGRKIPGGDGGVVLGAEFWEVAGLGGGDDELWGLGWVADAEVAEANAVGVLADEVLGVEAIAIVIQWLDNVICHGLTPRPVTVIFHNAFVNHADSCSLKIHSCCPFKVASAT